MPLKSCCAGGSPSPMLFNIAVDVLQELIHRAKRAGLIRGVVPCLVEGGVNMLQYVDDTILLLRADKEEAKVLKNILCLFEHLSGLKINFNKGELFCL